MYRREKLYLKQKWLELQGILQTHQFKNTQNQLVLQYRLRWSQAPRILEYCLKGIFQGKTSRYGSLRLYREFFPKNIICISNWTSILLGIPKYPPRTLLGGFIWWIRWWTREIMETKISVTIKLALPSIIFQRKLT